MSLHINVVLPRAAAAAATAAAILAATTEEAMGQQATGMNAFAFSRLETTESEFQWVQRN